MNLRDGKLSGIFIWRLLLDTSAMAGETSDNGDLEASKPKRKHIGEIFEYIDLEKMRILQSRKTKHFLKLTGQWPSIMVQNSLQPKMEKGGQIRQFLVLDWRREQ